VPVGRLRMKRRYLTACDSAAHTAAPTGRDSIAQGTNPLRIGAQPWVTICTNRPKPQRGEIPSSVRWPRSSWNLAPLGLAAHFGPVPRAGALGYRISPASGLFGWISEQKWICSRRIAHGHSTAAQRVTLSLNRELPATPRGFPFHLAPMPAMSTTMEIQNSLKKQFMIPDSATNPTALAQIIGVCVRSSDKGGTGTSRPVMSSGLRGTARSQSPFCQSVIRENRPDNRLWTPEKSGS
jgi:hypothetical protein